MGRRDQLSSHPGPSTHISPLFSQKSFTPLSFPFTPPVPNHSANLGFNSLKPNCLLPSGRSQCKGTRSLSSLLPSHPCSLLPNLLLHLLTIFSQTFLLPLTSTCERVKAEMCNRTKGGRAAGSSRITLGCIDVCAALCRGGSLLSPPV